MARLLIFAPCDNVIMAKDSESISLITVMSSIRYVVPETLSEDMPQDAYAPMRWFMFSHWAMEQDEIGKTFEQRFRLLTEQGPKVEAVQEFICNPGKPHQRVAVGFQMFPLLKPGTYDLTIEIREKGALDWQEKNRYPLLIENAGPEQPLETKTNTVTAEV